MERSQELHRVAQPLQPLAQQAHQRLLRAEVGAVAAIVLLEISVLLRQP